MLGLQLSPALYEGSIGNSVQILLVLKVRGLTRLMVKLHISCDFPRKSIMYKMQNNSCV